MPEEKTLHTGGKQAKTRKTTWNFCGVPKEQSLVFDHKTRINNSIFQEGTAKGLLQVAKERVSIGAKIKSLNNITRDELIKDLYRFDDFRAVKAKLLELIDKLNL